MKTKSPSQQLLAVTPARKSPPPKNRRRPVLYRLFKRLSLIFK